MGLIVGLIGAVGAIASAAVGVVKTLAVAGLAIDGLKKICGVLVNLAKSLGLIEPEVRADELGDKALQSGLDPEDFENYSDYVKAVEAFDDLDPEKSRQISEEDKIKKGMELTTGMMLEKYREFPMDKFCMEIGKEDRLDFFSEGTMKELGKLISADGHYISDFASYLDGSEKDENKLGSIVGKLSDIYKAGNPGISDVAAVETVSKL